MARLITDNCHLDFIGNKAIKRYTNSYTVDYELEMINRFQSKFKVHPIRIDERTYEMERCQCSLGDSKLFYDESFSRVLFTMSYEDMKTQLYTILEDLKTSGIQFNDINPGNILFDECNRMFKLTDFYWCNREADANQFYGKNDALAIEFILFDIRRHINTMLIKSHKAIEEFTANVGKVYNDGSFVAPGVAYQMVDIPHFRHIPHYHEHCIEEYYTIREHIIGPTTIADIGAASGFFTFNLIRDFFIDHAIIYETDAPVVRLLEKIKELYYLPLDLRGRFDDTTRFKADVTIWMNNYQWIDKEIGKERALQCLANVIQDSKMVFFQPAGKESAGTATVEHFKNKAATMEYIRAAGGKPEFIRTTMKHGGKRHLFKITK